MEPQLNTTPRRGKNETSAIAGDVYRTINRVKSNTISRDEKSNDTILKREKLNRYDNDKQNIYARNDPILINGILGMRDFHTVVDAVRVNVLVRYQHKSYGNARGYKAQNVPYVRYIQSSIFRYIETSENKYP